MQNHLAPPSYYAPWPSANSDTLTTVKTMQSPAYLGLFEAKEEISGPDFIDTLASFMEKNNIQPGMLNTLYNKVREFDFWFVIDDSGSMTNTSGLRKNTACENMQGQWHASNRNQNWMSRWEEVQNRLHLMTELLSCLPGIKITFSFMNRKIKYTFENKYLTPAACGAELHALINEIFTPEPDGVTPIYQTLKNVLDACKDRPTHICVFTDGRPFSRDIPDTQKHIDAVADLVIGREYPEYCPMTFMSCTDQDCDVGWLKRLDLAPFCAEVDDYISELRDVKKHQGKGFKFFSPGFYLMCCLAAALDPERLDKMDEEKPFTRKTMNEFRGINHSEKEYLDYFKKHPRFKQYRKYQSQFLSERIEAKDIMKTWCCGLFASKPVDFNKKKQQERAIMAARERQQKRQPMLAY